MGKAFETTVSKNRDTRGLSELNILHARGAGDTGVFGLRKHRALSSPPVPFRACMC